MSTLATTVPRKTAPRQAKPIARYWKGKAPKGAGELPSDSEEEEDEEQQQLEEGDEAIEDIEEDGLEVRQQEKKAVGRGINVALRDVNISKDGKVIVAGREEVGRTEAELDEESEEEEEEEEGQPGEEESSEYESESESEEEPPKPQFRPVFIPKRGRVTIAERELAEDTEEAIKRREAEAEERRKQSHDMVAESIKRELAEKEKEQEVPDVDDTDGLDPQGEFEAWRLRELARIKRDKEAALQRELEREEIERRRALPEEQRLKEDLERAEQSRKEKPKGQQKFLQKYWHKGAFHQDDEVLKKHDYTEATESTVDVTLLPKVMQVRNFGKRGRTKYTHLVDQDTTVSANGSNATLRPNGKPEIVCFQCGGPHLKKDCPQATGPMRAGTGANSTATGQRQWGPREDREEGKSSWRDRDRDDGYRRPRDDRGDDRDRRRDDRYGGRDDRYDRGADRRREPDSRRDDRRDDWDRRRDQEDRYERRRSASPRRERWRDDDVRREKHRPREASVEHDREDKRRRLD